MAQRNEHVPSMHRARSSILYTAWTPRTIGKPKERELRLQRSVFSPALFLSPTGTPGHFTFIHRPQFCQMKKKTFSSTVLGVAMNLEHCWKWHTYTKRISQLDRKRGRSLGQVVWEFNIWYHMAPWAGWSGDAAMVTYQHLWAKHKEHHKQFRDFTNINCLELANP